MSYNRKKSFAQVVREYYLVSRKPLAIVLLAVSGVASTFSLETASQAALAASALLVLNVLFDIHRRLLEQPGQERFERFHDAAIHFREKVERQIGKSRAVKIDWLGMGMDYGAPLLDDMISALQEVQTPAVVELTVVMLDPAWPDAAKINSTWPAKGRAALETFKDFERKFERELRRHRVVMEVYLYRHIPNWHGFALDEKYFYLGTCSWHGKRLLGGENPYELAVTGGRDEAESHAMSFLGWFAFCKNDLVMRFGSAEEEVSGD